MTIELDISEFERAAEAADGVGVEMRSRTLGDALRQSVAPTVRAAKRFAPVESGTLRAAVKTKIVQYENAWVAIVEPKRPPAFHRHIVEFGHGGPAPAPPHPYMAPAIQATRSKVQQGFEDKLSKLVERRWQTSAQS